MMIVFIAVYTLFSLIMADVSYVINMEDGLGRIFDGFGAISGGGATSKLLQNYPLKQRNEVLDFLFKPNFGASLQILKVEIGGDSQTTDGTEGSHMHEEWDENFERGYEWWIMKEAKKRNPEIKLYGLPWAFPGWIGNGAWNPYRNVTTTALYIVKWINGAKRHHNLKIDYIGIWNEKPYDSHYIIELKRQLEINKLDHVKIVANDEIGVSAWDIVPDMVKNSRLNQSVDIIGGHYTGTWTTGSAKDSHKPLWSSEDVSYFSDDRGAAGAAVLFNQNYIHGLMTSTIVWNLVDSYYDHLPHQANGLMTANQPWSGYYNVTPPIWTVAHSTQFVKPGWVYLKHDSGVGMLQSGGSYVSLMSPTSGDLTLIVETMDTFNYDVYIAPPFIPRKSAPQNVTFQLKGKLKSIKELRVWYSKLGFEQEPSVYFENKHTVKVDNGVLTLTLGVNEVYTLTTLRTGVKGMYGQPPQPKPFPSPYLDNFEGYVINSEPYNFAQQVGVFEVHKSSSQQHGKVMRQIVQTPPIQWCPIPQSQPINLIGNYSWTDVEIKCDVFLPPKNGSSGVFLAVRVDNFGCQTLFSKGLFFFLVNNFIIISKDLAQVDLVYKKPYQLRYNQWYHMALSVKGMQVRATLDNGTVFDSTVTNLPSTGFPAIGSTSFGFTDFDNYAMRLL